MSKYFSISETADILGVTAQTLRNWDKDNTFKPHHRAESGHRYYSTEQINDYLGLKTKKNKDSTKLVVGYCRVSSHGQKDDLGRQVERVESYIKERYNNYEIITDIGSGINYTKKGITKIIEYLYERKIQAIIIAYTDRLLRFGIEIIEKLANLADCEIISILEDDDSTEEQDLAEDIIQIITVFSAKINGRRAHLNRNYDEKNNK